MIRKNHTRPSIKSFVHLFKGGGFQRQSLWSLSAESETPSLHRLFLDNRNKNSSQCPEAHIEEHFTAAKFFKAWHEGDYCNQYQTYNDGNILQYLGKSDIGFNSDTARNGLGKRRNFSSGSQIGSGTFIDRGSGFVTDVAQSRRQYRNTAGIQIEFLDTDSLVTLGSTVLIIKLTPFSSKFLSSCIISRSGL